MNFRLKLAQIYIPAFVRKRNLEELFDLTANAFRCEVPRTGGLSYEELLKKYALFTRDRTEASIQRGEELQTIKDRLYMNANRLGQRIRESFSIGTAGEVMTITKMLYRILGIDFQGDLEGEIVIRKCYFSQFYSSQVCQVISSIDEGVAAGLSDGGELRFYQRITEGKECCRAYFIMKENSL